MLKTNDNWDSISDNKFEIWKSTVNCIVTVHMSVQHIQQTTDTQFIFIRIIFIRVEIMRMTVKHTNHVSLSLSLSPWLLDFFTADENKNWNWSSPRLKLLSLCWALPASTHHCCAVQVSCCGWYRNGNRIDVIRSVRWLVVLRSQLNRNALYLS